jgi:hypothetical protein
MSSQPAEIPFALGEPPVSLPAAEDAEIREALRPEDGPVRPPLEAALVQGGKISMGQLAQAHRDRLEKGGSILDIVVERGWVSAEEIAAIRAEHGLPEPEPAPVVAAVPTPAPAAQPAPAPAPVAESKPDPEPETPPAAYAVAVRLTTNELITAGHADDLDKVEALALAVVADISTPGETWPRFGGRFLKPETIVSVDIVSA